MNTTMKQVGTMFDYDKTVWVIEVKLKQDPDNWSLYDSNCTGHRGREQAKETAFLLSRDKHVLQSRVVPYHSGEKTEAEVYIDGEWVHSPGVSAQSYV